ncbi:cytochrome P450 [Zychaea mexicana]|uniref:cytochrome P450 n=1 Tax=Zychaea mexicana TaxID=64656 RepID=UPI0022FF3760|nr:cytochrome P450 [Zychaea mexicana]KAI9493335.1 cytochrome P450 [Zychaea mexicana]
MATLQNDLWTHERLPLITTAVLSTATLLYMMTRNSYDSDTQKALDAIPTPKEGRYPYIGHLLNFISMQAHKLKQWHDELGPVIRVQMGAQPWIVVSDPAIVHYLFVTKGATASNRPYQVKSTHYYSRDNSGIAFGNANARWRRLRAVAASTALSPLAVSQNTGFIKSEATRLVTELMSATSNDDGVDPLRPFRRASVNYVFQTVFGTSIETDDDPRLQSALEFTDQTNMLIGTHKDIDGFLPFMSLINKLAGRKKSKMLSDFLSKRDPFLRGLIRQALEGDKECMMKTLYSQQDALELKDTDLWVVAGDMVAGAATNVGYASCWLLAILLHHQDVYKQLCEEVDAFIGKHGRLPDFSERDAFPLLISAQKESMRFRGTNDVTLPHLVEKDVYYQGYLFPRGVLVLPSAYAMHRNPERYPEPDKFIATRFLNNTETMASSAAGKVQERDHFMFGWGRRICPAMHLAEVQMFVLLTNVLARCDIKPPADSSLPDLDDGRDAGAVMSPPPFKLRFVKRENSLIDS